jgi:hypothetical protein
MPTIRKQGQLFQSIRDKGHEMIRSEMQQEVEEEVFFRS